jgi:hypothetical protein
MNNKTIDSESEMNKERTTFIEDTRNAVEYITKLVIENIHIIRDFVALRVTAIQGYFDEIWTNKIHTTELNASGADINTINNKDIHTEKLCIKKSDGTEICLDGDQVEKIIGNHSTVTPLQSSITHHNSEIITEA